MSAFELCTTADDAVFACTSANVHSLEGNTKMGWVLFNSRTTCLRRFLGCFLEMKRRGFWSHPFRNYFPDPLGLAQ